MSNNDSMFDLSEKAIIADAATSKAMSGDDYGSGQYIILHGDVFEKAKGLDGKTLPEAIMNRTIHLRMQIESFYSLAGKEVDVIIKPRE